MNCGWKGASERPQLGRRSCRRAWPPVRRSMEDWWMPPAGAAKTVRWRSVQGGGGKVRRVVVRAGRHGAKLRQSGWYVIAAWQRKGTNGRMHRVSRGGGAVGDSGAVARRAPRVSRGGKTQRAKIERGHSRVCDVVQEAWSGKGLSGGRRVRSHAGGIGGGWRGWWCGTSSRDCTAVDATVRHICRFVTECRLLL